MVDHRITSHHSDPAETYSNHFHTCRDTKTSDSSGSFPPVPEQVEGAGFISYVLVSPVKIWLRWTKRSWVKTMKQYESERFVAKCHHDKKRPAVNANSQLWRNTHPQQKSRSASGLVKDFSGIINWFNEAESFLFVEPHEWDIVRHHGEFIQFFTTFFYLLYQILISFFLSENPYKFHALSPLKNASPLQTPFRLPCHLTRPRKRGPSSSTWLKTLLLQHRIFWFGPDPACSVPFDDASSLNCH